MASHKSAIKEMRKSRARRSRNRAHRAELRTVLKTARAATAGATPEEAIRQARSAASLLDRKAAKGVIHPNAASRVKSRLARQAARTAKKS